ncbi:MAG: arginine deiminase-related protein [Anaerolineales bacterium]
MKIAITRAISPRFAECELTHLERVPIDLSLAQAQHQAYEAALRRLGIQVISLPAEPDLPDSVFVEDAAIVLPECAIITRPGADSRRPETDSIARALAPYRALHTIQPPATLDGGDVLVLGKTIYVGISTRSKPEAVAQMRDFLRPYGYTVTSVPVHGCLHLKSAVTQVGPKTLLLNPNWVSPDHFPGWQVIEVHPDEPAAANAVLISDTIIYPRHYPKTQQRLQAAGIHIEVVDATEVAKAEGAVTCCSLLFEA